MNLRRVVLAVGALVAVVTLVGLPARATYGTRTSADEPQYLMSALSLGEDGDLDISDERYSAAYRSFHEAPLPVQSELQPDGSRLSPHNPLLPALLALPMLIGGWVAAKATLALLAGVLAALMTWIAVRRLGLPVALSAIGVAIASLSPPLAFYATQVYPELPAALAVAVAIALLTGPATPRSAAGLVAVVVVLPWLAVKYVFVAAALAAAALWRHRAAQPTVIAMISAWAALGAAYLAFNQAVYGGWTPYAAGDHFVGGELTAIGTDPNYAGRAQRLLGLWVDRGFGLVAWQPAYLLAMPALAWAARRRTGPWRLLAGVVAVGWLVATFVALTMHGWWWPGRQVVVILPAVVLLVLAWVATAGIRRHIPLLLGLAGVSTFLVVAVEATAGSIALIVDFTETAHPGYQAWSTVLPDYLSPTAATWVLHGMWLIVAAGLAVWGWRSGTTGPEPASVEHDFALPSPKV